MTDRPIIFSAPMVRALLDGRKTQTRRIVRELSGKPHEHINRVAWNPHRQVWRGHHDRSEWLCDLPSVRWRLDDRLWVKEAHTFAGSGDPGLLVYRADYPACVPAHYENVLEASSLRWRPSIHMARASSRLTLFVMSVKVERLQDISEADARAEGISPLPTGRYHCGHDEEGEVTARSPITAFGWLWNSLHGPDAWAANPWVAAITFTVEQRNIDAVSA